MSSPITFPLICLLVCCIWFVGATALVTLEEICHPFIVKIAKLFKEIGDDTFETIGIKCRRYRIRRSIIFKKRFEEILCKVKISKENSRASTSHTIHQSCLVDDEIRRVLKKKGYSSTLNGIAGAENRHLANLCIYH